MSNNEIITSEVADRYATALMDLAPSASALITLEKDLKSFKSLLTNDANLARLAQSPVVSSEDKTRAFVAIAKAAGYSKLTTQFIGTVCENHRAPEFLAIINAFERKLTAKRGIETGELVSATKLSAAQVKAITDQLKKSTGHTVELSTRVDPSLLGGFIVQIGSRYFDSSLKTKLDRLTLAMKEA